MMRLLLSIVAAGLLVQTSLASVSMAQYNRHFNTYLNAIIVGQQACLNLHLRCTVAIKSPTGVTKALAKMGHVLPETVSVALSKAFTSGTLGIATNNVRAFSNPGKPYYNINGFSYQGGQIITLTGGIPVYLHGRLLAGVGVASSPSTQASHKWPRVWISHDARIAQIVANYIEQHYNDKSVKLQTSFPKSFVKANPFEVTLIKSLPATFRACYQLGHYCNVAVDDTHGTPILIAQMDGALPMLVSFAQAKAMTSASIGQPTSLVQTLSQPNEPYYGVQHFKPFGRSVNWVSLPGGLPIFMNHQLHGGVGVTANKKSVQQHALYSPDFDVGIAKVFLQALKNLQ